MKFSVLLVQTTESNVVSITQLIDLFYEMPIIPAAREQNVDLKRFNVNNKTFHHLLVTL